MDDLVTWLRAQLDLKQAHAEKDLWVLDRATNGGAWTQYAGFNLPYSEVAVDDDVRIRVSTARHDADTMAIARFVKAGRARALEALAEVDTKRRILDRYQDALARQNDWEYSQIAADICVTEYEEWLIPMLALPYAGRPGYDESWRP